MNFLIALLVSVGIMGLIGLSAILVLQLFYLSHSAIIIFREYPRWEVGDAIEFKNAFYAWKRTKVVILSKRKDSLLLKLHPNSDDKIKNEIGIFSHITKDMYFTMSKLELIIHRSTRYEIKNMRLFEMQTKKKEEDNERKRARYLAEQSIKIEENNSRLKKEYGLVD